MYGYLEVENLHLVLELRGISTKMVLAYMIFALVESLVIRTVPREFSLLLLEQKLL